MKFEPGDSVLGCCLHCPRVSHWLLSGLFLTLPPVGPPLTRCRGQNPGQGHVLGCPSWGWRWLRGFKLLSKGDKSLLSPYLWGREGSGLKCCVPLSFTFILPHCKDLSGEVARDSGIYLTLSSACCSGILI